VEPARARAGFREGFLDICSSEDGGENGSPRIVAGRGFDIASSFAHSNPENRWLGSIKAALKIQGPARTASRLNRRGVA